MPRPRAKWDVGFQPKASIRKFLQPHSVIIATRSNATRRKAEASQPRPEGSNPQAIPAAIMMAFDQVIARMLHVRIHLGKNIYFCCARNQLWRCHCIAMLCGGAAIMKHAALLTLLSFALSCPVLAKPHYFHHHDHHHYAVRTSHHVDHYAGRGTTHPSHTGITCEMVRAYVAKVGLGQAIAMAQSAGISAADEQRAKKCLAKQI